MRWLPRLLSHAAAAGRIPARTATSHGFASGGPGRGGGAPGGGAAAEALVRSEEPERQPDAAKRPRRPTAAAEAVVRPVELKKRPDAAKRSRRPAGSDAVVRSEESKKKRRRDAADKKTRRQRAVSKGGGGVVSLGGLASAVRAFVNSKVAALRGQMARAWRTAGKEHAPSTSCRHGEELDLARVQAKLKPLLSRADLIIARRVEWANIMFGFQQKTRYIIKDPLTPRRKNSCGSYSREKQLHP